MLFAFLMILLAILFVTIELPPLIKEKRIMPSILYFSLILSGITFLTLYGLDVKLPNPLDLVIYFFKPISSGVFSLLK